MTYCLTVLECGSIQSYIFASNRLSEAVGGSELVKQATESILEDVLKTLERIELDWKNGTERELQILQPDSDLQAEIWYSGGGNAVVIFDNINNAKLIVKRLSSELLAIAPGLNLLVSHREFDENTTDSLSVALDKALKAQATLKERAWANSRREGLSINRPCDTTGRAAAISYDYNDEAQWLSAGAAARRASAENANTRLRKKYKAELEEYEFPLDLDNLSDQEGQSRIAVVHIDGNSIGKKLQKLLESRSISNGDLSKKVRKFSKTINDAGESAIRSTLKDLHASLETLQENGLILKEEKVKDNKKKVYFPLRPLVEGGDDLTFVCEGRLGLPLAARYLKYFSEQKDSEGEKLSACAGVVIARSHFPLSRAYKLAEELCSKSKSKIREKETKEKSTSWLDFQIIFSGVSGQLDQLREDAPELYWRPWRVIEKRKQPDSQSWQNFRDILLDFQQNWPRSQVKALREALALGEDATNAFLSQAKLREHFLHESVEKHTTSSSWQIDEDNLNKTILYDPIEALDFYLELKAEGSDAN